MSCNEVPRTCDFLGHVPGASLPLPSVTDHACAVSVFVHIHYVMPSLKEHMYCIDSKVRFDFLLNAFHGAFLDAETSNRLEASKSTEVGKGEREAIMETSYIIHTVMECPFAYGGAFLRPIPCFPTYCKIRRHPPFHEDAFLAACRASKSAIPPSTAGLSKIP